MVEKNRRKEQDGDVANYRLKWKEFHGDQPIPWIDNHAVIKEIPDKSTKSYAQAIDNSTKSMDPDTKMSLMDTAARGVGAAVAKSLQRQASFDSYRFVYEVAGDPEEKQRPRNDMAARK